MMVSCRDSRGASISVMNYRYQSQQRTAGLLQGPSASGKGPTSWAKLLNPASRCGSSSVPWSLISCPKEWEMKDDDEWDEWNRTVISEDFSLGLWRQRASDAVDSRLVEGGAYHGGKWCGGLWGVEITRWGWMFNPDGAKGIVGDVGVK